MGRTLNIVRVALFIGILVLTQVMPLVGGIAGVCYGIYMGSVLNEWTRKWEDDK